MTRLVLALLVATATTGAYGHDAPAGWSYSAVCCSDQDCGQLHSEVSATAQGWFIAETGETIGYADRRVKDSQDEFFHRCENRSVAKLPNGLYASHLSLGALSGLLTQVPSQVV